MGDLARHRKAPAVCIFIWALRAAGAERVASALANEWSDKGWDVSIVTMEGDDKPPFYPLAPEVRVLPLDLLANSESKLAGLLNNLKRVARIRDTFTRIGPDVVVSFVDKANVLAVLAARRSRIPVVASERTDPSRRTIGRLWEFLRNLAYGKAARVVFQSNAVKDWFPANISAKGVVVPNPVRIPADFRRYDSDANPNRRIVGVGRLFRVKGFDVLMRAFVIVAKSELDWTLEIWGEGPERADVEQIARNAGVEDRVRMPGVTGDPFAVLREADIFVLPSRAEGFPNALVEAMACGLPVVSSDFGGAIRDIVDDGKDGLVVPAEDENAMAEAILRLIREPETRARLGESALRVSERFSPETVFGLWRGVIEEVLREREKRWRT